MAPQIMGGPFYGGTLNRDNTRFVAKFSYLSNINIMDVFLMADEATLHSKSLTTNLGKKTNKSY